MNFNLSDDQKLFVESASRYVRERSSIEHKRSSAKNEEGFSREHWQQFAEMGWLALTLPERVDGLEGTITDLYVLMEQVGQGVFHEPITDTPVLCGTILASANTPAADAILSQVGTGEAIVALAHIEAGSRCEMTTSVNTRAVPTAHGWQLHGAKERVFYAPQADQFIVSAQLDNALALFLVAADTKGLCINRYPMIDGSHAGDITLEHVELDESALLLQGEAAEAALNLALDKAIVADCARAVGSMELVMGVTAEYLKTRVQYGKPIAQFQALQHRMSEMLVDYEQAVAITYRALSLFENAAQRPAAVSAAKVLVSKTGRWVVGQGIQLHGGIGVTEEYAVGHHYKAMLTLEQRFGDSEWHLKRCESLID